MSDYTDADELKRIGVGKRTIASLRLNIEAAMAGQIWLLLPEGFRDQDSGKTYPLPSLREDIQKLIVIPIPAGPKNSGVLYVKRAIAAFKTKQARRQSAMLDVNRRQEQIVHTQEKHTQLMKELRAEARAAVDTVREEVAKAAASLKDLFALGREGLDGQMKAHLSGTEWQGERIDARAFRECYRMVSQTVKALGIPSDQKESAERAIMEEAARAIESTRATLSGEEPPDEETRH